MAAVLAWFSLVDGRDYVLDAQSRIMGSGQDRHDRSAWTDGRAQPVEYLWLRTGLERTRFGEAFDRFDLCIVLGDAFGRQM